MAGRVFISCGQRPPKETEIAKKIQHLLKEFNLDSYLAFTVQSLDELMKITKELSSCDYYLFVDFKREKIGFRKFRGSLFTHQELALAYHLRFKEIIALQENEVILEGFLKYLLSNPEHFSNEKELLEKIGKLVKERGWTKDYSRNLTVEIINNPVGPIQYGDHTGTHIEYVWQAQINNHRPDIAAVNTVCILDYLIFPNGERINCYDRSCLKWAGQIGYQRTILPKDSGIIDLFAIHGDSPGAFLHSARDLTPRDPILDKSGDYILCYKLFSDDFPLVSFSIDVKYNHSPLQAMKWDNNTKVEMRT